MASDADATDLRAAERALAEALGASDRLVYLAAVYARASWVNGEGTAGRSVSRMRGILVWRRENGAWRVAQELLHADPDG